MRTPYSSYMAARLSSSPFSFRQLSNDATTLLELTYNLRQVRRETKQVQTSSLQLLSPLQE
jgi:hypothetical protein